MSLIARLKKLFKILENVCNGPCRRSRNRMSVSHLSGVVRTEPNVGSGPKRPTSSPRISLGSRGGQSVCIRLHLFLKGPKCEGPPPSPFPVGLLGHGRAQETVECCAPGGQLWHTAPQP